MYESPFQEIVTDAILNEHVDRVGLSVTDNEHAVVVDIADNNAAYTADEARELAKSMESVTDNDAFIEYLRDLTAVVDSEMTVQEVYDKWDKREIKPGL